MMICSSCYAEQHHRYVQLKIHIRDIVSDIQAWILATSAVVLNHNLKTLYQPYQFFIYNFDLDKNIESPFRRLFGRHTKKTSEIWSAILFSKARIVLLNCILCIFAQLIRFDSVLCSSYLLTRTLSSLISIVIAMRPLSMQTKIKWNNLVFLMLICYLAADGLIHHANTNALAHIHKLLSTPWYNVYRAFDIDAVGEKRAQPSSISAHVIKWFMHSFWIVEHSCPCTKQNKIQCYYRKSMGCSSNVREHLFGPIFFPVIECMSFQTFTAKAIHTRKKMTRATCRLGCT